jgi:hypothetical protein
MADGNLVILPLRTCKRCEKAQVPCHTTGTTTLAAPAENTGNASVRSKRKMPPIETQNEHDDATSKPSNTSHSPPESESVNFSLSPVNFFMPSTGTTPTIDLSTFEFDTGSFDAIDVLTPPSVATQDAEASSGVDASYEVFTSSAGFEPLFTATGNLQPAALSTARSVEHGQSAYDECRKRLLELHSLIFDRLHRVTDADLANSLMSAESMPPPSRDRDDPPTDIVNCVLFASERLIELLRMLDSSNPPVRASSSHAASFPAPGQYKGSLPAAPSSSNFLRRPLFPFAESPGRRNSEGSGSVPSLPCSSPNVDLPVVISFLACYVGLLSVYRTIFAQIHERLRVCDPVPSSQVTQPHTRPQSKRALLEQAEGSTLNHEQVLKVRIQLEVMTHMLDRIGRGWAKFVVDKQSNETEADQENGSSGDRVGTMALLQCMLMHEGYECRGRGEGLEAGLGSLELAIDIIRRRLRSDRFSR